MLFEGNSLPGLIKKTQVQEISRAPSGREKYLEKYLYQQVNQVLESLIRAKMARLDDRQRPVHLLEWPGHCFFAADDTELIQLLLT